MGFSHRVFKGISFEKKLSNKEALNGSSWVRTGAPFVVWWCAPYVPQCGCAHERYERRCQEVKSHPSFLPLPRHPNQDCIEAHTCPKNNIFLSVPHRPGRRCETQTIFYITSYRCVAFPYQRENENNTQPRENVSKKVCCPILSWNLSQQEEVGQR